MSWRRNAATRGQEYGRSAAWYSDGVTFGEWRDASSLRNALKLLRRRAGATSVEKLRDDEHLGVR